MLEKPNGEIRIAFYTRISTDEDQQYCRGRRDGRLRRAQVALSWRRHQL